MNNFNFTKSFLLTISLLIGLFGTQKAVAQCGQVQYTISLVSATYTCSDCFLCGAPDPRAWGQIVSGMTPVSDFCLTPAYPEANTISGSATMSQIFSLPSVCASPGGLNAAPNTVVFGLRLHEDDSGTSNCDIDGGDDDDTGYRNVTFNLTRSANGCFTSNVYNQSLPNVGCWTNVVVRLTLTYPNPAPIATNVTMQQGNAVPQLQVTTGYGGTYTWANGAGTGLTYTPAAGSAANQVNTCVPGTYPVTLTATHECSGAVSAAGIANVDVLPRCPEIQAANATPNPDCEGDAVSLGVTFAPAPTCVGLTFVEGSNYLLQWYMDGTKILDGLGPDGVASTADDIINLTNTTFTPAYTGTTCSYQDHTFEARIICLQTAKPLNLGGPCPYGVNGAMQMTYEGNTPNNITNAAAGITGTVCPGVSGSLAPPGHDLAVPANSGTGTFNTCTGRFTGNGLTWAYDLSALPACAIVSSVDYEFTGHSLENCTGGDLYGLSWQSEANFVFYAPSSAGPTGSTPGGANTSFFWHNAQFTSGGTNVGGAYTFAATNSTTLAGTPASGVWKILFFDDFDDTTIDGEVRRVGLTVRYTLPPGCGANSIVSAPSVRIWDRLDAGVDYITPSGCGYTVTGVCSNANVKYSATGAAGTYTLAAPPVTPANGEIVYYQVAYNDPAAPTNCTSTGTYTINNLPNATFNYTQATYCKTAANPTPTQAQVGVYAATPAGLSINAATGLIDLAASAFGTYTLTHTVTLGVCNDVKATTISVVDAPTVNTPQAPCNAPGTGYTPSINIVSTGASLPAVTGAAGTLTGVAPNYVWTGVFVPAGTATNITVTNPNNPVACGTVTAAFNPTCTPTTPVSCAECGGPNLVTNWNFETGNSGFTSNYTYSDCAALPNTCASAGVPFLCEYRYGVYNATTACIPSWNPNIGDHTTGTGNFMMVNYPSGNVAPNNNIWCQTIPLTANTTYSFGANFLNLLPPNSTFSDPQVAFTVGGVVVGNTITTLNDQLWHFSGYQFTNTVAGAATLCITSQNSGQLGNDLGIDDIILRTVSASTTFPNLQADAATICVDALNMPILPITAPSIAVLNNDNGNGSSLDATTLSIAVNPDPNMGEATVVGSNVVFTPIAGVAITAPITFTYRVCNAAGCCNCTVVTINPEVAPVPSITTVPTSVCLGASSNLTVTPAGLVYDWAHLAGTNDPQVVSATPSAPSSSYTVTATSAAGCKGSTSVSVVVNPIPVAGLTGPLTSCTNPLTLTATPNTGVTYGWSAGATAIVGTNTATAAGAGVYTVTVTTPSGCSATASWTITPGAAAAPTIAQTASCGNVALAVTPNTYTNYNWAHLAGTNDPSAISVSASGVYTVTVTGTGGCSATATTNVVIPVALSGSFTQTNVSCFNGTNGSVNITAANGTAPYQYSFNNGPAIGLTTYNNLAAGTYSIRIIDAIGCIFNTNVTITAPTAVALTLAHTDASCAATNGSITATATGGTPGYTYSLNGGAAQGGNSFLALAAATYTVVVSDTHFCSTMATVIINSNNAAITAVATVTQNSNCAGAPIGVMSASGSGGTAPYTFQIDNIGGFVAGNIFNNLSIGTHTLQVRDANTCAGSITFIITQPSSTVTGSITAQTNIVGCNGGNTGAVTVLGANGVAPYSYNIDGGSQQSSGSFINLAAGGHTVIISDANGCTANVPVTITQSGSLVSATAVVTPATCNTNGSATLTPSGGTAPYLYSLNGSAYQSNPTFNGLAVGTYPISIKDNLGCVGAINVTVATNPVLLTLAASAQPVRCTTLGSVVLSAAQGSPTYYYAVDGSALQQNNAFANLSAGSHTALVTDVNGCTKNIIFNVTTAANPLTAIVTTTNPVQCSGTATGNFTVAANNGQAAYTYSNGGGFQSNGTFNNLMAGNYTVTASDANGCTATVSATISPVLALGVSANITNVACYGGATGSVVLQGAGGTAPYTYYVGINLSNPNYVSTATFGNLLEGSYVAAVRDANGCIGTLILSVREPAQLALTILAKADATCSANGSVTIGATGGTAPYSYFIDAPAVGVGNSTGVFTNLAVGSHTVTVRDANGCTSAIPFQIQAGAGLNLTPLVTSNALCNGANNGSATVTVVGGSTPYQYLWDNGSPIKAVSNLTAGVHTVIITDAKGCTAVEQVTITQPTAISITNSVQGVSCNNAATGRINFSVTASGAYVFALNNGVSNQSGFFDNLTSGTYTVTVNAGNNCTATASVTIAAAPAAVAATPTVTNSVSCFGGNNGAVTVSASGGTGANYNYVLNSNNGGASATNNTGSFSNLPAGSYTVIVKDGNNCTTQTAFAIGAPGSAPAAAIANITPIKCASGTTGGFTIVASGGTAGYTYSVNNVPSTTVITNLSLGVHTVIVSDANGCTATALVNINAPQQLFANATTGTIPCNGATASATVTTTGGTGAMNYLINTTPPTSSTTGVFSNLATGNYTVVATDANMCSAQTTFALTQPSQIVINIATPTLVACLGGNNGTTTITAVGGGTPYNYEIPGRPIQSNGNFIGLTAGNYIVTVTSGSGNGCSATRSFDILQPVSSVSAAVGTTSNILCKGGNDAFAAINATGGTAPYTYTSNPATTIGNNILYGLSANIAYTVTVRDANGCTATTSVTVSEPNTSLSATAVPQSVKCFGEANGSFTVQGLGGTAPYRYAFDGGTSFTPPTTGSATSANTLATGTYTVIVEDANRCTQVKTVFINQPAQLVVTTAITNITCAAIGGTATVTVQGGTAGYLYATPTIAFNPSNILTNLPAGITPITVKDANGCLAQTTATITAADALTVEAHTDKAEICEGQSINLTAIGSGGSSTRTYYWAPAVAGAAALVTPTTTTAYTVTITDASGCSNTASVNVIVNTKPVITFTGNNAICAGQSATIQAFGGLTYQWNNGVTLDQITVTQAGIYNVIATSDKGCTASKTAALQVRALPTVSAGADIRVYDGEHFQLDASGAGTGGTYTWISGDGLHATNIPNPEGHVDVNTTFVVQVTDQYGCKNTDEVLVEIKDELECIGSTSGFTPNADGFNDTWAIPCLQYYPDNTLEIFNRWGQTVFSARNYNNDFGGIYNGTALPDGTYYYVVNITSSVLSKTTYKGTITIIR